MPLSDPTCKNAKPKEKPYKLADEKGMFLLIHPNGSKYFRLKYRFDGKEKVLALGVYPEISLKEAREKRTTARKQIADGIDPSANRKAVKQSRLENAINSFEVVAREWHTKKLANKSERHRKQVLNNLEVDIFPWLGGKAINDIKPMELLEVIRRIEDRGAVETAHRSLQRVGQVFRYGVATGRCDRDIGADLKGALPEAASTNFAALTEPAEVGELLRAIDGYTGTFVIKCALRIMPLVFVRSGELTKAQWADIDLDAGEWRYLVTKTNVQHIVPLSRQVIAILRELHPLTGRGRFVFPCARTPNGTRAISSISLTAALRRMGYSHEEMTIHGFRATARTMLDEVLGFRVDFIEHQLAHAVKDPNGRAYNRTAHLKERHEMMQAWADYLQNLPLLS